MNENSIYKRYGIYGIQNTVNGKIYIGKTMQSFGDRWDCHKACLRGGYHCNNYLQNSWNKYGENNFQFVVIQDCTGQDLDFVNNCEMREIAKYRQLGLSYNIHDGGDGGLFLGKHLSDEAKHKIGEKNRAHMLGKKPSNETKKKMSDSYKNRYAQWTDEDRTKWGEKLSKCLAGISKPSLSFKMKNNKHGAKYTVEQIKEIRKLHEVENKGYTEISKIMNIPRPTVYLIATYRRWKET